MLDDIIRKLEELHQTQLAGLAKGELVPITLEVNGEKEVKFFPPLICFSMFNDGPDEVYPMVNQKIPAGARETPLKKGESLDYDAKRPVIKSIYLVCGKDKSAVVRVFGCR